jgi:hypothetical protein
MSTTPAAVPVSDSEILLSGPSAHSLSPIETAAVLAVESATCEARRLADLVKDFGRAGTAAKTLCGIHLRHIRHFHFGPRNPNGGRPKLKTPNVSGFSTWGEFLADRVGITDDTSTNWIKMADAVESLAESKGLDLQSMCQKLPWDWTPEESAAIDATVHKLTQDKTQRQLLQADFLSSLGYEAPEHSGTNNPTGKNGGKLKPAATAHEKIEGLRILARTSLFGHDSRDHRPKPGSPAFWMNSLVAAAGKVGPEAHPAAALSKKERSEIYDLLIKPFLDSWKALDAQ